MSKENKTQKKIFKDKSRVLILFLFIIVLVVGLIFAFFGLQKHHAATQFSGAGLKDAPQHIESLPGLDASNPEYIKLQQKQNSIKAEEAEKRVERGNAAAAIPTITRSGIKGDSSSFTDNAVVAPGQVRLGCSPEEVKRAKAAGVTVTELRCKGCTAKDLSAAFSAAELRDAGFTAAELKAAGFSAAELREAGFSAKELIEGGFTAKDLRDAGYSVAEMKDAGVTLKEMQDLGFTLADLKEAGFTAAELKAGGFSVADLKASGFSAEELRDAGASFQELNDAGFLPQALIEVGATDADLTKLGMNPDAIKALRASMPKVALPKDCSVSALVKAKTDGISASALKDLKCDAASLKAAGYTAAELEAAGFTAAQLKAAGFTAAELQAGGFTAAELKSAGFSAQELQAAGFPAKDLKAAGFSSVQLKDAGFGAADLKMAGFTAAQMRDAGYSADDLLKAGVSNVELRTAGFTAAEMKAGGASAAILKSAGFSDGELIRAGFTAEEINPPPKPVQSANPAPATAQPPSASPASETPASSLMTAAPSAEPNSPDQLIAMLQKRQAEQLSAEQKGELLQQIQIGMTNQANELFASWNPPPNQQYVAGEKDKSTDTGGKPSNALGGSNTGKNPSNSSEPGAIVKAGSVMFAVLDTGIDSDEVSPILATIVQGPLKGAKLLGQFSRSDKKVVLNFTTMSMPQLPNSIAVNAVAIDPDTARTAVASSVDNHYLLRYGSLFASSFLTGYASAVSQSGATTTLPGLGNEVITQPPLSANDKIAVALGQVGTQYSSEMGKNFSTPPTVKVDPGSSLGILFMADLTLPSEK